VRSTLTVKGLGLHGKEEPAKYGRLNMTVVTPSQPQMWACCGIVIPSKLVARMKRGGAGRYHRLWWSGGSPEIARGSPRGTLLGRLDRVIKELGKRGDVGVNMGRDPLAWKEGGAPKEAKRQNREGELRPGEL